MSFTAHINNTISKASNVLNFCCNKSYLQSTKVIAYLSSLAHLGILQLSVHGKHNISHTNKQRHFYSNRMCRLWNSLPIINLSTILISKINRHSSSGNTLLTISMLLILISYIISALAVHVSITPLQTLIICSPLIQILNSQSHGSQWLSS